QARAVLPSFIRFEGRDGCDRRTWGGWLPRGDNVVAQTYQITSDVRFGSKADMCNANRHVRFTPKSDIKCDTGNVRFGPKADIDILFDHLVGACEHRMRYF